MTTWNIQNVYNVLLKHKLVSPLAVLHSVEVVPLTHPKQPTEIAGSKVQWEKHKKILELTGNYHTVWQRLNRALVIECGGCLQIDPPWWNKGTNQAPPLDFLNAVWPKTLPCITFHWSDPGQNFGLSSNMHKCKFSLSSPAAEKPQSWCLENYSYSYGAFALLDP